MRRLKRFANLSRAEQRLVLRAMFLVAAIRVGLWLLPFRILQRIALKKGATQRETQPVQRVVWAVTAASRQLPGMTCMTQALAAQILLAQSGHQSRIEIGVAKDEQRRFEAHAWLVYGDQIILGGPNVDRYTSLLVLEGR